MSEDRRSPPPDWRHGGPLPEEPPHLHGPNLRDDPEVQQLLKELSAGLKPGEDPLFYELPDDPDDPEACAPNEAKVYVAPTALPAAHHKTIEMERVKVRPEVDPRRAVTQRVPRAQANRPADPKEDAPPMSGPASAGPRSVAGRKRTVVGALVVAGVAAAIGIAAVARGPREAERAEGSATAATAMATANATAMATANATAVEPTATAATPSAASSPAAATVAPVSPSALRTPPVRARGPLDDPYGDAAVAPAPSLPAAVPSVTPKAPEPSPQPSASSSAGFFFRKKD